MGQHLLEVAAPWLASEPAEFQVHAWRYARPRHEPDHLCLILNQSPALLIAGSSIVGGQAGASVGRRLSPIVLRALLVVAGLVSVAKLVL